MSLTFTERDRAAARYTHRLFWRASGADIWSFILWFCTRPPALLVYNVLIPFQVAYGLQAIITRQFDTVGHYGLSIMLLGLIYCLLWAVGGYAISRNGKIGTEYVQKVVFANYLEKDYEFFGSTHIGSLGSQATRLKDSYNEYCQVLTNGAIKQVIVVVASIVIVAYKSIPLALVTLVCMTIILAFTIITSKWRLKYRRLVSEANSETAGVISDALSHGTTVKSFAAEEQEKARLSISVKKLVDVQQKTWNSSIPADVGRITLAVSATTVLLILTSHFYESNAIPIAIVILIQIYVIRLVLATQDIADLVKAYEAIMGNAHQAVKTMLIKPHVVDKVRPREIVENSRCSLAIDNISYSYSDAAESRPAIDGFTLRIEPGEKVGFVGYSGSGKTTLTKLLLRFMDVTSGEIRLDGVGIRDLSQQELRKRIAYVPQEPLLFHRSIAENIHYGRAEASDEAVRAAGRAAYVDEFAEEFPAGYHTLVGEKGIKLSGGQRQRVAIARALLKDAPILVLDEATSALDSRSEQYIQQALWKLMENRTALVVAHRLSTIQRMDRIVVIDQGRIVEVGTHQVLIEDSAGIYAQLWAHQSGGYLIDER